MSAPGKGAGAAPKGGKGGKDNTIAQVTGAVIASGVVWSLYKSIRGRSAVEKDASSFTDASVDMKKVPSTSRPKLDIHYEVTKGDTLWSISRRYGVTVFDVKEANAIPDVDFIVPGENLVIPQ
ncbi:hypothetical protein MPTK1_2g20930 [Marchantia polymorpha subsp. ruderalis]|nr:hypothetical protein MARPO_0040s0119 [Marchantia polymorpha]BBN03125.1 hypothetical protein Mp_2g20930 [Marchantia polymorpha subsp. ruderalis]|eukprot:PTQ40450.1 hypothetical protein MARPO_0040s0119 [Marchantia polymorpha]